MTAIRSLTPSAVRLFAEHNETIQLTESRKRSSGYITLEGKATMEIVKGSCGATLFNKMSVQVRINEASLAFDMTANIFNPCIVNGQWGRSENDYYSIRFYHLKVSKRDKEAQDDVRKPAEHKPADGHTYCTAYIAGPPPPVPAQCLQAIDGLASKSRPHHRERNDTNKRTELGSKPVLEINQAFCARYAVGGCWAHVCNHQNHKIELDKKNVKSLMMDHVFNSCVTKGNYGMWLPDTGYFSLSLFEPPQQKMSRRDIPQDEPDVVPLAEVNRLIEDLQG